MILYSESLLTLFSPGADAPPVWLILAGAPRLVVEAERSQLAVVRLCQHQLARVALTGGHPSPGSSQDFNPRLVLCQVWISQVENL